MGQQGGDSGKPEGQTAGRETFGQAVDRVQAATAERRAEEEKGRQLSLTDVERVIFGAPESKEGSYARDAWERLMAKKGYETEKERIMLSMRQAAEKVFAAMEKRIRARRELRQATVEQLDEFQSYLRTVGVIGQAVKMQITQHSDAASVGPKSHGEVVEIEEIMILDQMASKLNSLDVEELVDMVLEDQEYITMLAETTEVSGKSVADCLPQGYELRGAYYVGDQPLPGNRVGLLKPPDPHNPDKPGNPDYHKHLGKLRRFILGLPEEGGKEKSDQRRVVESTLWMNIVRNLTHDVKRDLIATFLKEGTREEAMSFINSCVIAGVMSRDELLGAGGIYEERNDEHSKYRELFAKLGKDFPEQIDRAIKQRDEVREEMAGFYDRIENVYHDNMLKDFGTFNNLLAGRLMDIGTLTVLANVITSLAGAFTDKQPGETFVQTLGKGLKSIVKNEYIPVGAAIVAGSAEVIWPWMRSAVLKPSSAEKAKGEQRAGVEFFRKQTNDKPEAVDYFIGNYENLLAYAKRRENEDRIDPQSRTASTRGCVIYPEDLVGENAPQSLKISEEIAAGLGMSQAQAAAAVVRMFDMCTRVFNDKKINNQIKLVNFLDENGIALPRWETPKREIPQDSPPTQA